MRANRPGDGFWLRRHATSIRFVESPAGNFRRRWLLLLFFFSGERSARLTMASVVPFSPAAHPLRSHVRRFAPRPAPAMLRRRVSFCVGASSPSDVVGGLHSSVNGKDMKALGEVWAEDCLLEDFSFSKPFQGRKEVTGFFGKLADSMGENLKLVSEVVHEGKETTAAVWHLEWKGKKVPFTRGCAIYHLAQESGETPQIRRALVAMEWPLKPGHLSLQLLKIVASALDSFPRLSEKFLQKPEAVGQLFMSIWWTWVNPLTLPLLMSYAGIWAHALKFLRLLAGILLGLLRKLK